MGSFGKIGFLSSLPIEYGDETCLIFLSKNPTSGKAESGIGGICNHTDIFISMFLPIFGEYDDYGRIDNVIDSPIIKTIIDFFGEDNISDFIDKVDDNAVGRYSKTPLETKKNNEIFKNLTFCLEHKSVYEKLSSMDLYKDDFQYGGMSCIEILEQKTNYPKSYKLDGIGFSDSRFARILSKSSGITYIDPIKSFVDIIGENDIMEFLSFDSGISTLNGKYYPSNYGSQSQDHVLHYKMLTHYRNIIVNKFKKYDEPERILEELKSEIRDEKLADILK